MTKEERGENKDPVANIAEAYKVISEGEQQAAAMEKALDKIEAQLALMEEQLSNTSSSYSKQ